MEREDLMHGMLEALRRVSLASRTEIVGCVRRFYAMGREGVMRGGLGALSYLTSLS